MEKPIRSLIWYPAKIHYHIQALVLLMFIISGSWACLSTKNCLILTVTQPTMWISPFHLNLVTRETIQIVNAIICVPSDEWGENVLFLELLSSSNAYSWMFILGSDIISVLAIKSSNFRNQANVFRVKWSREEQMCLIKSNSPEATDSQFSSTFIAASPVCTDSKEVDAKSKVPVPWRHVVMGSFTR